MEVRVATKRYVDSYSPSQFTVKGSSGLNTSLRITFSEGAEDRQHSIEFSAFEPRSIMQQDRRKDLQRATDLLSACELTMSPVEISIYKCGHRTYVGPRSIPILNYNSQMERNVQLEPEDFPKGYMYLIDYRYLEYLGKREILLVGAQKESGIHGEKIEHVYCVNLKAIRQIDSIKPYLSVKRNGQ